MAHKLFTSDELSTFTIKVLEKVGVNAENASLVADTLIQAELRGVESHGVVRLPLYVKRILQGGTKANPCLKKVAEGPATAIIDGDSGMGQIASYHAIKLAMDKARRNGIGAVGVRNSSHFGTAAYYTMVALKEDMIGIALTNSPTVIAPTGGITPLLGNNPWSIAVPAGKYLPIVVDFAISVVARGKIRLAALKNEKIPYGWANDSAGNPTQDPLEALKGAMMPIGGHKGYGMALAIDLLAGVLTGSSFGPWVKNQEDVSSPQNVGHFFVAIDIDKFMPVEDFKNRVDALIERIKSSRLATGCEKIYIPGELEYLCQKERSRKGIPVSQESQQKLSILGKEVGVPFPALS
ncbi:Ldh family oxidoreductase [Neomoorella mulderi]|uniref:Putative oxidoreductase YjmC n=1 Tax=Moorella mulderi DSM 14980 TaxID=1122241 RepID=A0A151ASQ4_9FIRM|nr:Ldh family oxidoreductase [Moorella mulderi]KYH30681.1 putative oxidoreductase YjmC [Moorella mulderi DSM 14980]